MSRTKKKDSKLRSPVTPDYPSGEQERKSVMIGASQHLATITDLEAESEALLDQEDAAPPWAATVIKAAFVFRRRPGVQALVTAAYFGVMIYTAWVTTRSVQVAGLADSAGCAVRASMAMWTMLLCLTQDWCMMVIKLWDPALPCALSDSSKMSRDAAHASFAMFPAIVVIGWVFQVGPIMLWLRHGLADFASAAVLLCLLGPVHGALNTVTFNFWAFYVQQWQREFQTAISNNEQSYAVAVVSYSRLNACRKKVTEALELSTLGFMIFFLMSQVQPQCPRVHVSWDRLCPFSLVPCVPWAPDGVALFARTLIPQVHAFARKLPQTPMSPSKGNAFLYAGDSAL